MINFWSYKKEYKKYKKKVLKRIDQTLLRGTIFFGDELNKFEKKFISKYKSKFGAAVSSGTDALLIALKSIDIKNGDEVITASNTAIPTISAIINSGATPKLVDVGNDYLIDCSKIENDLGWKPSQNFRTGLKKTIEWYLDNLEWCNNINYYVD